MSASGPTIEYRDIRCWHSEALPALLADLRLSVLISTYQTGHLVVVAAHGGRLMLAFHGFDRAMGVAEVGVPLRLYAERGLVRAVGPGRCGPTEAARPVRCLLSGADGALHRRYPGA
jgi:hypothetical protein